MPQPLTLSIATTDAVVLALRAVWIPRSRVGVPLTDLAILVVHHMLNPTLDGHLAPFGLCFGLRRSGVGHALVTLSAVRPVVDVPDGVDVTLTHAKLPISTSTPRRSERRTHVPIVSCGPGSRPTPLRVSQGQTVPPPAGDPIPARPAARWAGGDGGYLNLACGHGLRRPDQHMGDPVLGDERCQVPQSLPIARVWAVEPGGANLRA